MHRTESVHADRDRGNVSPMRDLLDLRRSTGALVAVLYRGDW
jgi:hypothetical protein